MGIHLEEIYARRHNIWIGISLSNRLFDSEHIRAMLDFALQYTKEKILIWVPGRIQATNYYYFEKFGRAESLRRAFADEDRMKDTITAIVLRLPVKQQAKITVANYDETCDPVCIKRREIFFREFSRQSDFYHSVLEIAKNIVEGRGRSPEIKRLEAVALYILHELPYFVGGIRTLENPVYYTAILYPGMGKLDVLTQTIMEGRAYPALTRALDLRVNVGIVDIDFRRGPER